MNSFEDFIPNNPNHKRFPNELVKMFQKANLHLNSNGEQNDRRNNFVAVGNNNGIINAPAINLYINGESVPNKSAVPANISRTYYNLFVIDQEDYEKNYFFVEPKRAVSRDGHSTTEIVKQFGRLDAESIAQIKTFPSIFTAKSRVINYKIDPSQTACFGFVKDVKVQQNEFIKVYFEKFKTRPSISQQKLVELMTELKICERTRCNELEYTHWAIKNADLIEVLGNAGINIDIF